MNTKLSDVEKAKVWKCRTPHPKQKFSARVGAIFIANTASLCEVT
jgi:hypothetical protein